MKSAREKILEALEESVELSEYQLPLETRLPKHVVMLELEKLVSEGIVKKVPGDYGENEMIFALR